MELKDKILNIIISLQPFLSVCGGDIDIVNIKNKTIELKITGKCVNCTSSKEKLLINIFKVFNDQLGIEYNIIIK